MASRDAVVRALTEVSASQRAFAETLASFEASAREKALALRRVIAADARAYEALGRRNPDTLLFRGTKWEITVADVALYCWIAYYARI